MPRVCFLSDDDVRARRLSTTPIACTRDATIPRCLLHPYSHGSCSIFQSSCQCSSKVMPHLPHIDVSSLHVYHRHDSQRTSIQPCPPFICFPRPECQIRVVYFPRITLQKLCVRCGHSTTALRTSRFRSKIYCQGAVLMGLGVPSEGCHEVIV